MFFITINALFCCTFYPKSFPPKRGNSPFSHQPHKVWKHFNTFEIGIFNLKAFLVGWIIPVQEIRWIFESKVPKNDTLICENKKKHIWNQLTSRQSTSVLTGRPVNRLETKQKQTAEEPPHTWSWALRQRRHNHASGKSICFVLNITSKSKVFYKLWF